ncbi:MULTISPECIES: hypothetical protein [Agrobacterium]|uniref:hypothetical protein n=1 Tax=Agrobacterium tumefaciens TaxID=358 RepID=UPI0012963937|nr:hypothetical protein [Agrobacterium tumefaciens]MQB37424.1 hypothetical protein [Agrobacterium tumefaciens]
MRSYFEQRAMLSRLEAARAETERRIAIIERQIAARAERMTTSSRVKARQFGHASTTGIRADKRDVQANIAALRFERRGEIEALDRRLARQVGAIAAFRVRYRVSGSVQEAAS